VIPASIIASATPAASVRGQSTYAQEEQGFEDSAVILGG
jgi:hypothetical protein